MAVRGFSTRATSLRGHKAVRGFSTSATSLLGSSTILFKVICDYKNE